MERRGRIAGVGIWLGRDVMGMSFVESETPDFDPKAHILRRMMVVVLTPRSKKLYAVKGQRKN